MHEHLRKAYPFLLGVAWSLLSVSRVDAQPGPAPTPLALNRIPGAKPRNVVFILTDDHRYDALGFIRQQSFVRTPHLDQLARGGVHLPNAFVTTALCSPSRASILTGLYAHKHRVVDNNNPVSADLVFYPQYLQAAGYQTALVGKWHMGDGGDQPQRGFDHWVSFKGQGTYLPSGDGLNVNGQPVPQKGYITDELTDYALDWLRNRKGNRPFMLYLSHKGVHADFVSAERHRGRYRNEAFVPPATMNPANHQGAPMWVQNQRNSWHGTDYPYHSDLDIGEYYKQYAEALLSVDESVGRVMDYLREAGLLESTLVIYMGDNGFQFGEHGLIDKRTAYEASMRVPMIAHCPDLLPAGSTVKEVVANIDIAPTILEAAGLAAPAHLDGKSFLSLAAGKSIPWRKALLYEYYWERNFPQTPTLHALRGDRYKYIHYHGIWDTDELYDLQTDPREGINLINHPDHQATVKEMNGQLFELLGQTAGMYIPLYPDRGQQHNQRHPERSTAAKFPDDFLRNPANPRKPAASDAQKPEAPTHRASPTGKKQGKPNR